MITDREQLERLEAQVEEKKRKIRATEDDCIHRWSPTQPAHIYHKAYTIPGDPPGTMGIDWRGPCHVPARTEKRWKRTCNSCGKVEFTTNTKDTVVSEPEFR